MMDKDKWLRKFERNDPIANINMIGNLGSTIKDNNFIININPVIISDVPDDNSINGSNSFSALILPHKQINKTAFDRQYNWNIFLEQILKIVQKTHEQPTLRLLMLYSGFCCLWEESNRNDIAMLELQERELLISLVKAGCRIKTLVNLDVDKAFACGFSREDIYTRISDLCMICDLLSTYKNFQFAVDFWGTAYEPSAIFEDIIMTQNYNFYNSEQNQGTYKGNYTRSIWHSDRDKITTTCEWFDGLYKDAHRQDVTLMKVLNFRSISELIWYIVSEKVKEYESYS